MLASYLSFSWKCMFQVIICLVPGILMILNGQSCEVSIHIKGLSRAVASVVSITVTYFKY